METILPTAQVVNHTTQVQVLHLAHCLARSKHPIHFNFFFLDLVSSPPPQLWPLHYHISPEMPLLPTLLNLNVWEMPLV